MRQGVYVVNIGVQHFASNRSVSTFPVGLRGEGESKVLSFSVNSLKWPCEFSGINGVQSNWCYSLVPEEGKLAICFYGDLKKKSAYCVLCVQYNKYTTYWVVLYVSE